MTVLNIYTDGAAKGNPGPAGVGVVILDNQEQIVKEASQYIGKATNNVAEYQALITALELAVELGAEEINIYADSQLMIRQLRGEYRVRSENLIDNYRRASQLLAEFSAYNLNHIPREENQAADRLANLAIDEQQGQEPRQMDMEKILEQIEQEAATFKVPPRPQALLERLLVEVDTEESIILRKGIIYGLLIADKCN